MSLLNDCYISYLNLDCRPDRREHIETELARVGIKAERTRGKLPEEFDLNDPKLQVQVNRTPGSIGCWHGMVEIAEKALTLDKHAMIFEDDLLFCDDIHKRFEIIEEFIKDNEWDVIWLGGTVHINPHHWHTGSNPDLLGSDLGRDCEYIGNKYLYRSFGSFSTHSWILNKKSIRKVVDMLDSVEHLAMGVDWAHIKIANQLNNYVFLPGCIIQRDDQSNIGRGWTIFSGFKMLGAHWFAKNLSDFDHDTYNWGEAKKSNMTIQYRRELPKLLRHYGLPMIGVEVGVAQGSFSWELLYNGMGKLYSVDAWKELPQTGDGGFPQSWHDDNYEMAKEKLSEFGNRSIILKGISHEMAKQIEDNSLSLVYLDGDHSLNGVRTDLAAWYPKLVTGGIIATHDYESPAYGTKQAFEEFAQNNGVEIYLLPEDKEDDAGAYIFKK